MIRILDFYRPVLQSSVGGYNPNVTFNLHIFAHENWNLIHTTEQGSRVSC